MIIGMECRKEKRGVKYREKDKYQDGYTNDRKKSIEAEKEKE